MLNTPASLASATCRSPAWLHSCMALITCIGHAGCADRVALGLQAARGVDRQPAADRHRAVLDAAMALALVGQAHGFVRQQLGDGEAVVHLRERQVVDADARFLRRLPGRRVAGPSKASTSRLRHRQQVVERAGRP